MHTSRYTPRPAPRVPRSPGQRLRDAVGELAAGMAIVTRHTERNWASITFAGARHRLELLFEGAVAVDAGERLIACLPEHEFTIPGQLVAEATVVEVDHSLDPPQMRVTCEVLLLEEV